MCPSIETLSGSPFVETIRIEKGRIHNLPYHNARMNHIHREPFRAREEIDLAGHVHPGPHQERTKCRVEYTREVLQVEYVPYHIRPVHSLRLVTYDEIDYSYRSTDRQCLNDLFAQRGGHDDILIIRDGLLTDTSICNIVLWNGTSWIIPARPLLCGTMHAYLLDKGLVQAGDIPIEDLPKYIRIRLFNALIGFGGIDEITRIYVRHYASIGVALCLYR